MIMASYLDYARRDGDRPERWPNLREAAAKPWMGQTAVIGRRPWLVVGFDGEMYELENEFGDRMRSNKFEVLEYESANNKLVAATRIEGSPLDAGFKLVGGKAIGSLDFDRESYEWGVLTEEGTVVNVESHVVELEDADWKVADTMQYEVPFDPEPGLGQETEMGEHLCPECGSHEIGWGDDVAYCEDCGWHGQWDEVLTDQDRYNDMVEDSPRFDAREDDDWQYAAAERHPLEGAPDKVVEIFSRLVNEGMGRGETPEEKKVSCVAMAWAAYRKDKKSRTLGKEAEAKTIEAEAQEALAAGKEDKAQELQDRAEETRSQKSQVERYKHQGNLAKRDVFGVGYDSINDDSVSDRKDNAEPLKCPNCGSHTVELKNSENTEFHCLACGEHFKHDVIKNPSAPEEKKGSKESGPYETIKNVKDDLVGMRCPRCGANSKLKDGDKCPECGYTYKRTSSTFQLVDSDGKPVASGHYYNLHGDKYKIPDVIKVLDITSDHVVATIDDNTTPLKLTASEIESGGYSFEPLPIHSNIEKHDLREAASFNDPAPALHSPEKMPGYAPRNLGDLDELGYSPSEPGDPEFGGNQYTLPTPSGGTLWVRENSTGEVTGWSVPSFDGGPGQWSTRDLEKVQSQVDAARTQNVRGEPTGIQGKTARRAFTPGEQKKLIEEKGNARNRDKLRLEDSHYIESTLKDDPDFLF